ncbi:MAG: M23 family metallopeptidase [Chitinophagales bacterium]|nr:M23 family metallopeptidase [Chitinophagales bacterium]MDW8392980.1 M23 family metallopeptidase [Chitinophagales bacterium]
MKKIRYYYNTQTLRYEKYETPWQIKVLRFVGFLSAALVFAFIIMALAYTYLDSPKEKALKREIAMLRLQYRELNSQISQLQAVAHDLQQRDDQIYRVIFEAEPISASVRQAGSGGVNRYRDLLNYDNGELVVATAQKLDQLRKQLYIQSKSYDEIAALMEQREEVLASIPAIQPISNKNLKHIASGFGMRIDPIYKIPKMHEGIDFTAPVGTPVYATGDAVVHEVEYSRSGYGNHVILSHKIGYKTLYAHLSRIVVRRGQQVKRGDLLGYVGSSGKSTAPHLHYEVWKNNVKLDPINFFFNDLTPEQYEELLKLANQSNQSFD